MRLFQLLAVYKDVQAEVRRSAEGFEAEKRQKQLSFGGELLFFYHKNVL